MSFLEVVGQAESGTAVVPDDWSQGRATFGGMTAAMGLRSLRTLADGRRVRSVLSNFVAPVAPGPVSVQSTLLRRGKSMTHARSTVDQGQSCCTVVTACFADDRGSSIRIPGPKAPEAPSPDSLPVMPHVPGITPSFTQHFEFRWATPMPFTGHDRGEILGYCRFRDGPSAATEESILGLLDSWPAPVLPMLKVPSAASSVTWNVQFLDSAVGSVDDHWLYQSSAEFAESGYVSMRARLWDPRGIAVVESTQLVAVFG